MVKRHLCVSHVSSGGPFGGGFSHTPFPEEFPIRGGMMTEFPSNIHGGRPTSGLSGSVHYGNSKWGQTVENCFMIFLLIHLNTFFKFALIAYIFPELLASFVKMQKK